MVLILEARLVADKDIDTLGLKAPSICESRVYLTDFIKNANHPLNKEAFSKLLLSLKNYQDVLQSPR